MRNYSIRFHLYRSQAAGMWDKGIALHHPGARELVRRAYRMLRRSNVDSVTARLFVQDMAAGMTLGDTEYDGFTMNRRTLAEWCPVVPA